MTDIIGKDVFLSAPMEGLPHHNVAAIAEAHAALMEMGATSVYDPAIEYLNRDEDHDHKWWVRRSLVALTDGWDGRYEGDEWETTVADVMVQMRGWQQSDGCRVEAVVADACGIPRVSLEALLSADAERGMDYDAYTAS